MSARPEPFTAPQDPGDVTHLELRFGGSATLKPLDEPGSRSGAPATVGRAHEAPPVDLTTLLDSVGFPHVRTLDVTLPAPDLGPAAAASLGQLVERLPALQRLTLRFTGPFDTGTTSGVIGLHESWRRRRGLTWVVDFVIEDAASAFEALGRPLGTMPPTSMHLVREASRLLRREGVSVRWIVPVRPSLVYRLEGLFSLARDEGVDPVLTTSSFAYPDRDGAGATLDDEDRLFVSDFITYRLLDEERHLLSAGAADCYRALNDALTGSGGPPCTAPPPVVLHAVGGERGFRWTLADDTSSVGGPPGEPRTRRRQRFAQACAGRLVGQALALCGMLLEGISALAQCIRTEAAGLTRPRRSAETGRSLTKVLLIGAYGGEHIGDAAILGGVLLRINRRYGTTEAVLMSQRPAHTRHLIPMLDTPFKVDVDAYERSKIREHLSAIDAVVFAGGPLIDLPRQLVNHLYTVSLASRARKPFIMEGIGPGPFPRRLSEWTARRIVRAAERISVRTSTDAASRLLKGLEVEVGRDPAFDYLATREPQLTRLRDMDRRWIQRLLRNTDGRQLVGVNLRPIRHLFTAGVPVARRAEHTRLVEARFEERLAEGMRVFHQASSVPPCFIFFPMNAIQFGMSDLRSAYRVQRALGSEVEFRVWEADASLDGVVALLRRLDIVISMRFHATIFALAQQRRVIGIDYRIGERDKVGALLDDFGQSENCCRIDELTSTWLFQRLSTLAGRSGKGQRRNPVLE